MSLCKRQSGTITLVDQNRQQLIYLFGIGKALFIIKLHFFILLLVLKLQLIHIQIIGRQPMNL